MRKFPWKITVALALAVAIFMAGRMSVDSQNVLKGAAIAILVDKNASSLNRTINSLTANKNVSSSASTRVVPILSLGQGSYVGAAQVSGPAASVSQVSAVAQLETGLGRSFRIRALVPVQTRSLTNVKRIQGVGASAVIDVRL